MVDKSFDDMSQAFDYCREANKPVVVRVEGMKYQLFPSGRAYRLEKVCPACFTEIEESITVADNGTCPGCGRNWGKYQRAATLPRKPEWLPPIEDTHSKQSHHYAVRGYAVVGKVYTSETLPGKWFYTSRIGLDNHIGYCASEEDAKAEIEAFIAKWYVW